MPTISEAALRRRWNALPSYARQSLFKNNYETFKKEYLAKSGDEYVSGTTSSGPGGPGEPDVIDTGGETIISGLPLFNKNLRDLLANMFTSALATAGRDASKGQNRNQILNNNPQDFLGAWLEPYLKNQGVPKTSTVNPSQPQTAEPSVLPGNVLPNGQPIPQNPPPTPEPQPDVVPIPQPQAVPTKPDKAPIALPGNTVAGGSLGNPVQMGGTPTGGGADELAAKIFRKLLGGDQQSTVSGTPVTGASFGLGEIASLMTIINGGRNIMGGQPEPQRQAIPSASPYEASFEGPNSLASFMQLLQMFGEGSGMSSPGASPAQGDVFAGIPSVETSGGTGTVGGGTGSSQLVNNPLTDIMSAFSLPSYQGPFTATSTPLQQQATDYASEFLRSNQETANMGNNTLQELITTGGRFDNTEQFKALEGITNRRMAEGQAQINENFGSQGLRYGSDVAKGQGGLAAELLAQESLNRAQIAQQSFENATNRRLQALGLAPQVGAQNLSNARTVYDIGESNRQIEDTGIQRMMAEFARTQGGLFPLLLQFALAGTEGDTVVLE